MVDPQLWNMYAYVRNNPLVYVDPDGRELRFAVGQTPADKQALTDSLAHSYQKKSFRQKFDQLAKSKSTFYVEKTNIPQPTRDPGSAVNTIEPAKNDVSKIDKNKPLSQDNFTDTIKFDNDKVFGQGVTPYFQDFENGHEFFHGVNIDNDVVGMGKTQNDPAALAQEEDNADAFGDKVAREPDSLSLQDATAAVNKALPQDQPDQKPQQQEKEKAPK